MAVANSAAVNTDACIFALVVLFLSDIDPGRTAGSHGSSLKILDFGLGEDLGREMVIETPGLEPFQAHRTGNEPLDVGSHAGRILGILWRKR